MRWLRYEAACMSGPAPLVPASARGVSYAACLGAAAAAALIAGWGFTVDDALISTRVAHHLATGHGYRFNPGGPVTDSVTPLGWAVLLAPLATESTWQALLNARWLGAACHLASAVLLGYTLARDQVRGSVVVGIALLVALCLPLGAWASSGMETPLITLLTTFSLLGGVSGFSCAALAAALRPELVPWALTLALSQSAAGPAQRLTRVTLVLLPAVFVAGLRLQLFGHAAPLAAFAKPSDVSHGLSYVASGVVLTGLPLLLLGARAYRVADRSTIAHGLAVGAHFLALIAAGGDWMALFRLFVPVLPLAAYVGARLMNLEPPIWRGLKLTVAATACMLLQLSHGQGARSVLETRRQLIERARPALAEARVVGTLDVGWVGACGDFEVVDFAGVTDPEVALLPGGHTSKRLPPDFLYRRDVDTLALLTSATTDARDWPQGNLARVVEVRVTQLAVASDFTQRARVELGRTGQDYVIARRVSERYAESLARAATRTVLAADQRHDDPRTQKTTGSLPPK